MAVARGVTSFRTNGRFRVRLILASCSGSKSIFRELALAEAKAVPVVRKSNVKVDNDGDAVVDGRRRAGTGKSEYAVVVVRTMRNDNRGLDKDR